MGGSVRSKAAADLGRKISPPVMNQTRLAQKLGVTQQAVSSWLKGRTLPEPERMAALEELLGIPMRDWVVPAAPESDIAIENTDEASDDEDEDVPDVLTNREPRGAIRKTAAA